jgi:hypothetical protein
MTRLGHAVGVVAGADLLDIASSTNEVNSEFARASVGWGLYATVLGGLAVFAGSLLTTIKHVRVRPSAATSQA